MRRPRHYLITLDAFGTIFSPRASIGAQYVEISRKCLQGVVPVSQLAPLSTPGMVKDVDEAFRQAFKEQYARFPHYGKMFKMTPDEWWTQVVERSIDPLLKAAGPKAAHSAPSISHELIRHFATSAAFDLHDDARALLRALKTLRQSPDAAFIPIVGILSNFDPRLRGILASFGLTIASVDLNSVDPPPPSAADDIDFVLVSHDVGTHKPDAAIFDAAAALATRLLPPQDRGSPLLKIHVGDSRSHDAEAALNAGWHGVLVDRDGARPEAPGKGLEFAHEPPEPALHILSSLAPWNPCILRTATGASANDGGN